MKWIARSKTFWANGAAAAMFATGIGDLDAEPFVQAIGVGAPIANVGLRFATKEALGRYGKAILTSKTVWVNLALLGGGALAFVADQASLGTVLVVVAIANLVLRAITRTGATVFPHPFS
jgi:hypothetical protein